MRAQEVAERLKACGPSPKQLAHRDFARSALSDVAPRPRGLSPGNDAISPLFAQPALVGESVLSVRPNAERGVDGATPSFRDQVGDRLLDEVGRRCSFAPRHLHKT